MDEEYDVIVLGTGKVFFSTLELFFSIFFLNHVPWLDALGFALLLLMVCFLWQYYRVRSKEKKPRSQGVGSVCVFLKKKKKRRKKKKEDDAVG
jgi:hypothetical protein